jgi:outer membrane protein TolC
MAARSRWIHRSLGVAAVLVLLSMGATPGANAAGDERPVLTFGSLMDPSQTGGTERLLGLMHQEIEALIRRDYDVRFPKTKRRTSDWTAEGISRELDDLLADSEVDMILVIGPFSTAALCCYPELPKPVFAPLGIDAAALGLPDDGNTSGVRNLNYLNNPGAALRDLEAFREIVGYQTVYIVSDPLIYEVLTELYERNQRFLESMGLTIVPVFAATSAYDVLDRLPDGAEAVYFTPLLRMSDDELRKLIDGLNARKIPTMSLIGRSEVEMGMLAGLRAPTDYPRMARRIALNVQQALFGEDPGTFSTIFERSERLVINMDTAREIGRYPTWRVLTDAELRNEEIPTAEQLTLSDAVHSALAANRRILSARRAVAAGHQAIREVRAGYLPQLGGSLDASQVDGEREIFRAQRTTSVGATLSQVFWSDPLATGIRVEKDVQRAREQDLVLTELDVAAEAATAYFDILRAQTRERIERDNLRRVEANLDLARNRVKIGYANAAEVYRWEVERANGKNAVNFAGRLLDIARVRMNQLMFREQERPFVTQEPDIERDPYLAVGNEELAQFYDNPWSFGVFRNFMVEDGLNNSPELRQLDAAIEARRRLHGQAKRAYWSPTIGFQGDYDRILEQSSDQSPAGFLFPDAQWQVGVSAALPLYTGGQRQATERRTREELLLLGRDRENLSDLIELRIRTAMFRISATWTNIDLSREAAAASTKNLDLVTDSYAKGVVSIQDLLDAQNAALAADVNAANAVYNFLIDLVEVQRAAGRLEWFKHEEDRNAWIQRIRDYFTEVRESGVDPGGFE